jgi:hypothetical protein
VEMGPWVTRWFRVVLRDLGFGDLLEIPCLYSAAVAPGKHSRFLVSFPPFR